VDGENRRIGRAAAAPAGGRPIAGFLSHHRGAVLVGSALVLTTVLWILGKVEDGWPDDLWPWRAPCQLTILWSLVLMAISLVAGARAQALEAWFGGLDRAVALHRAIGPLAMALLFAHIALLVPIWRAQGIPTMRIVVPFTWGDVSIFDVFTVASWGFLVLTGLAYSRRLRYERWRLVHGFYGLLFVASAYPSLFIPGSISAFEPLRLWMAMLVFAGTAALVYRLFLFRRLGPNYRYVLDRVVEHGALAYDLVFTPAERRMSYAPGMFVFLSVPASEIVPPEFHPFSLSSTPVTREMRLSIRAVGDYSRALRRLPPGHAVDVYGPFGGLTTHATAARRELVCIGAGMGITPFLGMLSFDATNDDERRIRLYYVVATAADAPYDDDIRALCATSRSDVAYALWASDTRGRITAAAVAEAAAGAIASGDCAVMLCGSAAFVADLTRQFRAVGVARERIVAEGFSFR